MWRTVLIGIVFVSVSIASANAEDRKSIGLKNDPWLGIPMTVLNVGGIDYEFPTGDVERKMSIYFIRKAMNGDREALDTFLGSADKKYFFVGKETPLWLVVSAKEPHFEVVEPNK